MQVAAEVAPAPNNIVVARSAIDTFELSVTEGLKWGLGVGALAQIAGHAATGSSASGSSFVAVMAALIVGMGTFAYVFVRASCTQQLPEAMREDFDLSITQTLPD